MYSANGWRSVGTILVVGTMTLAVGARTQAAEDEPRGLARLFRLGGNTSPAKKASTARHNHDHDKPADAPKVISEKVISGPVSTPAMNSTTAAGGPILGAPSTAGPSTPIATETGPAPRLLPQSRVQRPVTESDPILTRFTIGRSDNGGQFGMFLQIFADGTVLDGEGVHRVGRDSLRPIVEILESGDLGKLRGHCGAPPTDFVEQVHYMVYDRSYGKLRAGAFSFTGNPQGCDPSVKKLQAAVDQLVMKLASPSVAVAPASGIATTPTAALTPEPSKPALSSPILPLTNPIPGAN